MDDKLSAWASRQRTEYKNGTLSKEKIELLNSIGFNWETKYLTNISLAESNPELAAEWHPTKNGALTPADVPHRSAKIVWWLCEKGHEWQTSIANRSNGNGCPFCSGRRAIRGVNDLATLRPDLAAEWHPTKNGTLTPVDVLPRSQKIVWWLCEKGHEWNSSIGNRFNGNGCPVCANRIVLPGYNDLGTIRPDLAAEWHFAKNGTLTPAEVTPGSNKKVWWICANGHEWKSSIANRSHGNGCPVCAGERRKYRKKKN